MIFPLVPTKQILRLSAFSETTEKPGSDLLNTDNSFVLAGRGSPPVPVTIYSTFLPFS
jgi:hypothetical protein